VAGAVAYFVWDTLASLPARWLARSTGGVIGRNLGLAFQILLIVTVSSFFHKAPEFVYRAF
jgi:hypothetical protein